MTQSETNTQNALARQQCAIALPADPMQQLKPLTNENGELQLPDNIGLRMQAFYDWQAQLDCNLVQWETALLTEAPAGTTLIPIPLKPGPRDAWRGEDARKMKLRDGEVEPSAEFLIKMAQILGIELEKVFEGVDESTGTKMWDVQYVARITLANGTVLEAPPAGKSQELYTGQGQKQAHIKENTEKKAKRNAIKGLLGIPTTLPEAMFDRPWVLLRPVWKPGVSDDADRIIAEQQCRRDDARALLYSGKSVDLIAENAVNVDDLRKALEAVQTPDELEAVRKRLAAANLPSDVRLQLGATYKQKAKLFETGEVERLTQVPKTVDVQASTEEPKL